MFLQSKRIHVVDNQGKLIKKEESVIDKYAKPKHKSLKFLLVIIVLAIVGAVFWFGTGAFSAINKVITKNTDNSAPFLSFLGDVKPNQLQGEGDGRINILVFGIGGANHPGGMLADTIMVASFNPQDKSLAILSIPRDLYAPIPGYDSNKINAAHSFGERDKNKTGGGPALLKKTVANILDLPIHYFIRLDFSGFTSLIDTIGGLDINVETTISDPYYPDEKMIGYSPFSLSAGNHHLDGKSALKYARSRETTSDFDRSRRQQQLMIAIRDKILSLQTLSNPKKLSDIFSIVGDHVRTDMQVWEIQRYFELIKDLDSSKIVTKVLDNREGGLLTSNANLGGYYLVPTAGVNNFQSIAEFTHQFFADPYLAQESAKIEVINATETLGIANKVAEMLKSYGYNVVKVSSSDQPSDQTTIYDYTNGKKPFTSQFLSKRFKTTIINQPNNTNTNNIDISIIIGSDYQGL